MTQIPAAYRRKTSILLYLRILFIVWLAHAKKMMNPQLVHKKSY